MRKWWLILLTQFVFRLQYQSKCDGMDTSTYSAENSIKFSLTFELFIKTKRQMTLKFKSNAFIFEFLLKGSQKTLHFNAFLMALWHTLCTLNWVDDQSKSNAHMAIHQIYNVQLHDIYPFLHQVHVHKSSTISSSRSLSLSIRLRFGFVIHFARGLHHYDYHRCGHSTQ